MEEKTADEIAAIFSAAGDSVTVILSIIDKPTVFVTISFLSL